MAWWRLGRQNLVYNRIQCGMVITKFPTYYLISVTVFSSLETWERRRAQFINTDFYLFYSILYGIVCLHSTRYNVLVDWV